MTRPIRLVVTIRSSSNACSATSRLPY